MDGDVLPFRSELPENITPVREFIPEPTLPKVYLLDDDIVRVDSFPPAKEPISICRGHNKC